MKIFDRLDKIVNFHIVHKLSKEILIYVDNNEYESIFEIFKLVAKSYISSKTFDSVINGQSYSCDLFIVYRGYNFYYINIQKDDKS
jgi:hypothetical protein